MKDELVKFLEDYVEAKHWPLREYCRDTERVLGAGKGISITTISKFLRGGTSLSLQSIQRMAAYHGLPIERVMQMAGYVEEDGSVSDRQARLLVLRQKVQDVLDEMDRLIAEG